MAGDLDVAIGRAKWLGEWLPQPVDRRFARLEPLALLRSRGASSGGALSPVPRSLREVEIDATPEGWILLGGETAPIGRYAPEGGRPGSVGLFTDSRMKL